MRLSRNCISARSAKDKSFFTLYSQSKSSDSIGHSGQRKVIRSLTTFRKEKKRSERIIRKNGDARAPLFYRVKKMKKNHAPLLTRRKKSPISLPSPKRAKQKNRSNHKSKKMKNIETLKTEITKAFADVIGQPRAVSILSESILAYALGNVMPRGKIFADPGVGKSHLLGAIADAMAFAMAFREGDSAAKNVLSFANAEGLATLDASEFKSFSSHVQEVRPFFTTLDEVHTLKEGRGVSGTKGTVFNFLKDALSEGADKGRELDWRTSEEKVFISAQNFGCFFATNFRKFRDADALFRRAHITLDLEHYSEADAAKIICHYFHKSGLKAENGTLYRTLARVGRGTCEIPLKIAKACAKRATVGEHVEKGHTPILDGVVSKATAEEICAQNNWFLRGLTVHEMRLLNFCRQSPQKLHVLRFMLKREAKELQDSLLFLAGQTTNDGTVCPFVRRVRDHWETTTDGKTFLDYSAKKGFKW